ncbi:hypothetical protein LOK49_LG13G02481 [Camellia lanceoleosa]|uniref:Uncharacterized protein n=1 Tax=Camellia lanceoleosa TaxID=1840588 RepID=A0ACC0FIE6_9ERIC|nr:hypothetical protein LOK49_LG13G02481 [Camellia lanceoleosa]
MLTKTECCQQNILVNGRLQSQHLDPALSKRDSTIDSLGSFLSSNRTNKDKIRPIPELQLPHGGMRLLLSLKHNHFLHCWSLAVTSEVLNSMSSKMLELNLMIVKMVFESFGMEKYYELHAENNSGTLRMITYKVVPPITDSPTVGVPSHTEKFLDHFVSK